MCRRGPLVDVGAGVCARETNVCVTDDASRTTVGAARGRPAAVRPSRRTAVARPFPHRRRRKARVPFVRTYVDARRSRPPRQKVCGPVTWSTRLTVFCRLRRPRRLLSCRCDAADGRACAEPPQHVCLSLSPAPTVFVAAIQCPSVSHAPFNTCALPSRVPADAERLNGRPHGSKRKWKREIEHVPPIVVVSVQ